MRKQALVKNGKVRTYIDLSALYPADPIRQPPGRTKAHQSPTGCADGDHCEKKPADCADGEHCEHGAMREALEGWRWI